MSNLLRYVQRFVAKGEVFRQIFKSQQAEIDILNNNLEDLINNMFIETATWGLVYFEKKYGLKTDLTDTLENRRARILAKKRSSSTFNIKTIKSVASAFSGGEVDVIPHYEDDYFVIKFIGTKGIPPKLQDLYDAIDDIKHCHLDVEYEFTYNTVYDLRQFTVAQARTHTVAGTLTDTL